MAMAPRVFSFLPFGQGGVSSIDSLPAACCIRRLQPHTLCRIDTRRGAFSLSTGHRNENGTPVAPEHSGAASERWNAEFRIDFGGYYGEVVPSKSLNALQ
ncbi:hypothetical protein ARMGADRAFT_784303 [Armillaria gallica]|uniref:Uncharacterized protein n=1 Tax=Armillaria gallica TaxID=47427 RepID=A0A2H3CPZ7_ARMGA|nr:hypothetical protein ARMGADRAFT_784303 [Armillaria gallica]